MEQNKEGMTLEQLIATPYAAFHKRAEYEEQVMPLVMELHEKCKALNIPMFFVAAVSQEENGDAQFASSLYTNGAETTPIGIVGAERAANYSGVEVMVLMQAEHQRDKAAKARIEAEAQITRH